jgi:hypothetical protein
VQGVTEESGTSSHDGEETQVAGKTVARLPTFKGHAAATRQYLALTVKRSTRSTIRAAAKHRGVHRVS